ncbi:LysR family transcriptional regulator [Microbulbifer sp. S227A]|uniref:LysR family transcriptional regulator n=1 Tax=Microbulbifer sp. S227A TaxID=3415131 RepID=UPI003C7AED02
MTGRISNRQLRAYRAIVATGSVTRAAETLNLSQPTISRQISMLEDAIGFKLFERLGNNRLIPSKLGERFYNEVEGTLQGLEELQWIARGISTSERERIRISATPPVLNSDFFVDALDRFAQDHPEVELRVQWHTRPQIEAAVVGRRADIGVSAGPSEHPDLQDTQLLRLNAAMAVPRGHPAASKPVVTLEDITMRELLLDQGRPIVPHMVHPGAGWPTNAPGQIDMQVSLNAMRLVSKGNRVAICEPLSCDWFEATVAFVPYEPAIELIYGCYQLGDRATSDAQTAFVAQLVASAHEWQARHPQFRTW